MKTRYPFVIRGFNPTADLFDCVGTIDRLPTFKEATADDAVAAVSKMFTQFSTMSIATPQRALPQGSLGQVEARVAAIAAEQLGANAVDFKLDPGKRIDDFFDDWGVDSIDRVELVMALEDEFDVELTDAEVEKLTTVQQVVDLISGKLPIGAGTSQASTDVTVLDLTINTSIADKQDLRSIRSDLRESLKRWSEKSRVKGTRGWRLSALRAPKFEMMDDGTYSAKVRVILGSTVFYDNDSLKVGSQSDREVANADLLNLKRNLTKTVSGFSGLSAHHSIHGTLAV